VATVKVRAQERDQLAKFLGWFSVALGTAQLAAPRTLCRIVGADDDGRPPLVMRLMGVRELTQGVGILTRARPTAWLWSRVAGDALDLSLLGLVAARTDKRRRAAFAIGNVTAVTVPDVFEALELARRSGEPRRGKTIRKAVTIRRPRVDVEAAWAGANELREKVERANARVAYQTAPGDRGTELSIELDYEPTGGEVGAALQKLTGNDLPTQLADDLRRLKQRIETGEVVRSESTPQGHLLAGHAKQRPAQPLEAVTR
jgi:hypothetical protein